MKRSGVALLVGLVACFCLIAPAAAMFIVETDFIYTADNSNSTPEAGVHRVDFYDNGNLVETKYVPDLYEMSLKDAPYTISGTGSAYKVLTWQEAGSLRYLNNHITITADTSLSAVNVPSSQQLLSEYYEEYSSGSSLVINNNPNTIITNNTNYDSSGNKQANLNAGLDNYFEINQFWIYSSGETKVYVKGNDGSSGDSSPSMVYSFANKDDVKAFAVVHRGTDSKFKNGELGGYNTGKSSIGLETHPADYPNGSGFYNQMYKPIDLSKTSYNSNGQVTTYNISNYCSTRFVLECDVVYTGTWILGGLTGFAKQDSNDTILNWTQLNAQGFITGPYAEIDLNGYDLIVEGNISKDGSIDNSGKLTSYGSITDSSASRSGNLIIRSGAQLLTPFVWEDHWRENSLPQIVLSGMDHMQVFRCPYLDCSVTFESGSSFKGSFLASFGNSQGYVQTDINLIGSDDNSWIELTSGKIKRTTFYDLGLYEIVKAKGVDDRDLYDITYQKFKYEFIHADVSINPLVMSVKLAGIGITLNSIKYQKWIPPYFDFYSYGSTISLKQQYIFSPGCYLFADSKTTIVFGHDYHDSKNLATGAAISGLGDLQNKYNRSSGGLILCQRHYYVEDGHESNSYPFSDEKTNKDLGDGKKEMEDKNPFTYNRKGWFDTRKNYQGSNYVFPRIRYYLVSNEGYGTWAWSGHDDFWNYYGNRPAVFDFFGTFDFNKHKDNVLPYVLSGQINLANNNHFLHNIQNGENAKVQLYGSAAMSGPSVSDAGMDAEFKTTNIAGFYNYPLISNGRVLTPLDGLYPSYNNDVIATYDNSSGVIRTNEGKYYAFLFDDRNPNSTAEHLNYSGYKSGDWGSNQSVPPADPLSGQFVNVSFQNFVAKDSNNHEFVFYHGAFLPSKMMTVNGKNQRIVSVQKLLAYDGGRDKNAERFDNTRTVARGTLKCFKETQWVISGRCEPWTAW